MAPACSTLTADPALGADAAGPTDESSDGLGESSARAGSPARAESSPVAAATGRAFRSSEAPIAAVPPIATAASVPAASARAAFLFMASNLPDRVVVPDGDTLPRRVLAA